MPSNLPEGFGLGRPAIYTAPVYYDRVEGEKSHKIEEYYELFRVKSERRPNDRQLAKGLEFCASSTRWFGKADGESKSSVE